MKVIRGRVCCSRTISVAQFRVYVITNRAYRELGSQGPNPLKLNQTTLLFSTPQSSSQTVSSPTNGLMGLLIACHYWSTQILYNDVVLVERGHWDRTYHHAQVLFFFWVSLLRSWFWLIVCLSRYFDLSCCQEQIMLHHTDSTIMPVIRFFAIFILLWKWNHSTL